MGLEQQIKIATQQGFEVIFRKDLHNSYFTELTIRKFKGNTVRTLRNAFSTKDDMVAGLKFMIEEFKNYEKQKTKEAINVVK